MQFDRLDPAELVSLIMAALAGSSLYAILVTSPPLPQGKHITVLAAASMQNALDDINAAFTKNTDVKVVAGYAASSALYKADCTGSGGRRIRLRRLAMMFAGAIKELSSALYRLDVVNAAAIPMRAELANRSKSPQLCSPTY